MNKVAIIAAIALASFLTILLTITYPNYNSQPSAVLGDFLITFFFTYALIWTVEKIASSVKPRKNQKAMQTKSNAAD